ncbi:MAG: FGGY family carbohydrate kinase [Archaeoglobaceae archaeon]|nr:FGGY family carbohydrate kinase [Archaeoglobaceae archaeon]MDW8118416.1 FGGY-family carbohydrate kinase [Archaeoglobaceae archaeon]
MSYVLGIDAGTTGIRAGIYSLEGNLVAQSYTEFPSYYPNPGWVEQNAEDWWKSVVKACNSAIKLANAQDDIFAVSVTNQRETIVPVSKTGNPLTRAIVWQDRRTVEEVRRIKSIMGEEIFRITGLKPDPYFSLPKILWWMKNYPNVVEKTWKFMLVHDYIVYKLTGIAVTDFSNASRTMLMDLKSLRWSEKIAETFGVDLDKFPEIKNSGEAIGELRSRELELRSKPIIAVGGGDQQCSAFAQGVVEEGKIKSTTGTGTFMIAPVEKMHGGELIYSAHVVPKIVAEVSIFTTGSLLEWVKRNFFANESYEVLNAEAKASGVGARGLMIFPFFSGAGCPHWNPEAKGAFYGLTLGHSRGDIARAVMESVAFEVNTNVEIMENLGIKVDELRLDGGGAKSHLWNQIFADVIKKPCLISEDVEATARGAAMLACLSIGFSLKYVLDKFVPKFTTVLPSGIDYSEVYEKYRKIREILLKMKN